MNKEEYKKAYEKATEDIRKAEEELDSLLKMAKLKEQELDERRENLLVNLMEMDKNTITEEEEEAPSDEFTFVGETPNPSDLANRKSIVLHFKPFADNSEMKSEDVAIALERGVDYESATAALMFALIEMNIKSVRSLDDECEKFGNVNKSKVAIRTLKALADIMIEEEADRYFNELWDAIFSEDDEDEDEEEDDD